VFSVTYSPLWTSRLVLRQQAGFHCLFLVAIDTGLWGDFVSIDGRGMSGLMGAGLPKQQQPQQQPQQEQSSAACGCIAIVVILGILIAISWAACSACGGGGDSGTGGSGGYGYTLADYQMIDIGMSRSEVKSILGGNGEPVEGYPEQRMYINNADYSNIVVVYQGDVVVDKAQAGL